MACGTCEGTGKVRSDEPWFGPYEACGCVLDYQCPACDGELTEGITCKAACGWED